MTTLSDSTQQELLRRQKAASTTILGLIVAVVLLCVVAYVGRRFFRQAPNPILDIAVRIVILMFGLGAVALRRTKFSALRLQDIAALEGPSGLLRTLERTTLQVALLGASIALIGFVATVVTGNDFYAYGAGIVAVAVLLYGYPTQNSWRRALREFAPDVSPNVPSENLSLKDSD